MSETTNGSPYLTTKELAARIRKKVPAVRMMRHRGTGPRGIKVGRDVLYRLDWVEAWERSKFDTDDVGQRASA